MIDGKRIVGVCMTKLHDTPRSRTVDCLHKEAEKNNIKLIVFNSSFDFWTDQDDDIGAAKIYDYINYDIVDALIILCSGFVNKDIYRKIISDAKRHNTPVILENDEDDYCYTISNDFEDSLSALLNHVICEHGKRDTFFVAGIKGNEYSEKRIDVYKKVLAENGLEFDESMVDYGDFWDVPTDAVMDRLFAVRGDNLPEAIFCANDTMGIQVCKRLAERGIRVPEDIIVTGFDGSRMAEFAKPRLSSCISNSKGFVDECISALNSLFEGKEPVKYIRNKYSLRLSESCGCGEMDDIDFRMMAEDNYKMTIDVIGHEHVLFNEILLRINSGNGDIGSFYSTIAKILHSNSCIAMRPSFILSNSGKIDVGTDDFLDERLMCVAANGFKPTIDMVHERNVFNSRSKNVIFKKSDMMPAKELWVQSQMLCIIDSINVGKISCGYLFSWTENVTHDAHIVNRVLNLINMIIHIAVSDLRSRFLKISRNSDAMLNVVTELPNLRSLNRWFDDFVKDENNADKALALSVYEIPRYDFILDNYGIEEADLAACFVAEALKVANTRDSYIAHTREDQFVVATYYESVDLVAPEVGNSAVLFYNLLDNYNESSGKPYNLQVLSGCGFAVTASEAKYETLMKKAAGDMINNTKKFNNDSIIKESLSTLKNEYKRFSVLVEANLFKYHFQPIVSAKTGEIYGYEALMRTDESIGFNPLEVLAIAKAYNRLYDIEKATLFNVLTRYETDRDKFADRKVFINCIPGHFLNEEDNKRFGEKFAGNIGNCVFEITEQDTITGKELVAIRHIGNQNGNNSIAVDDYGAGHSNIINLINYKPEIVKVDRFLMTDIHMDESKQMIVKGVIDFARLNNIKVLAEGVETEEELRKVIELGVDFIQGYYTGRPSFEPVQSIDPDVVMIIQEAAWNSELDRLASL